MLLNHSCLFSVSDCQCTKCTLLSRDVASSIFIRVQASRQLDIRSSHAPLFTSRQLMSLAKFLCAADRHLRKCVCSIILRNESCTGVVVSMGERAALACTALRRQQEPNFVRKHIRTKLRRCDSSVLTLQHLRTKFLNEYFVRP
jgi:hypothetical protein